MHRLSDKEWAVMEVLWETGGAELGILVDKLYDETGWNRNTVLTYLTRMEGKGLVSIDKTLMPHLYRAALEREVCRAQERKSFLQRVYQGSAGELVTAFLKEEPLSAPERDKLRRLLDEMEV